VDGRPHWRNTARTSWPLTTTALRSTRLGCEAREPRRKPGREPCVGRSVYGLLGLEAAFKAVLSLLGKLVKASRKVDL
jgi:hypothetical protein